MGKKCNINRVRTVKSYNFSMSFSGLESHGIKVWVMKGMENDVKMIFENKFIKKYLKQVYLLLEK